MHTTYVLNAAAWSYASLWCATVEFRHWGQAAMLLARFQRQAIRTLYIHGKPTCWPYLARSTTKQNVGFSGIATYPKFVAVKRFFHTFNSSEKVT
jgi:hypothetical protein